MQKRSVLPQPSTLFSPGPRPPWVDRGILVFGPRKAGTTLFQNLLDGGDELLAYPAELKLKYFARHSRKAMNVAQYYAQSRVPLVESTMFDTDAYVAAWNDAMRCAPQDLGDLFRFDASCVADAMADAPRRLSMWCAKEVGGGRKDVVALWRRYFSPGKVLFIVRDPLMTTRAVLRERRRRGERQSLRYLLREVFDPLRTLRRQMRYLEDSQVHFTVYEDLVGDTKREMAKVCRFLGIELSPRMMGPSLFGQSVVVRTSSMATADVFHSGDSWQEGLTARERWIVALAASLARWLPWLAVDYAALRERIAVRERVSPRR
jgi:hypothetical protein